jgi:hypothetical protein
LNDHLGSTRIITNQGGGVTDSLEYYPFGESKSVNGCPESGQQFTGKLFDGDSGLQYFGARHMAEHSQKFMALRTT